MVNSKLITVCIPTYEMSGLGSDYLDQSLQMLSQQSFSDFNVVISDNSKNNDIKKLVERYKNNLDISYFRNEIKFGISANLNNAIKKSSGAIIKIIFQDDFLISQNALETIASNFDVKTDKWLITASEHTFDGNRLYRPFFPYYNDDIFLGSNTISSPSVLAIRNDNPLMFDENLTWLMDCDYYKRCYDMYGPPKTLNQINVVNRTGIHQVSNSIVNRRMKKIELIYILKKFKMTLTVIQKIKLSVRILSYL